MFNKLVDVLKEVFWIKKSSSKKRSAVRPLKKPAKKTLKKTFKKTIKKTVKKVVAPKAKAVKAASKSKLVKVVKPVIDPNLIAVGEITHYFERIKVSVVKVTRGSILIGDKLTIASKPSHFVQKVWSMQIESQDVKVAKKGQLIGLKVDKPVAVGDIVYK